MTGFWIAEPLTKVLWAFESDIKTNKISNLCKKKNIKLCKEQLKNNALWAVSGKYYYN